MSVCVWVCVRARASVWWKIYSNHMSAKAAEAREIFLSVSVSWNMDTNTHVCMQHVSVHSSTSQLQICWSLLKPPKAIFFGCSEIYRGLCTPLWCVVKKKVSLWIILTRTTALTVVCIILLILHCIRGYAWKQTVYLRWTSSGILKPRHCFFNDIGWRAPLSSKTQELALTLWVQCTDTCPCLKKEHEFPGWAVTCSKKEY